MKRAMIGMLAAFVLTGAVAAQTVDQLGWMAGDWVQDRQSGLVEESWMAPRAGVMLGMSRTTQGERGGNGLLKGFEYMRISQGTAGQISFFAQPGGVAPTEFPVVEVKERSVTFANDAHDYPNRVRYWREGDRLMAEISGKDGANPMRWSYVRKR